MKNWKEDSVSWRTVFEIGRKKEKISQLEKEMNLPEFWKDKEKVIKCIQEFNQLKKEITEFDQFKKDIEGIKSEEELKKLENELKEKELKIFLSGKYDKGNAILTILAGAGGQDAQDWATILLRMYQRYCQRNGFEFRILEQSFGEGVGPEGRIGTKSAVLEIKGDFVFGLLKKETGVHRLVRISPFSAKGLRHTSFCLIEVLPQIPKPEIKIRPEDLKIEFFRASGPGGQYVNKKETAVRVTHLPTGISAVCQAERSQAQNKDKALEILQSKLYQYLEQNRQKEISKIKGKKISVSWGNQIRSYIFHPYKLVKDLRTGVETSDLEGVLDGNLDRFIEAEIKL